MFTKLELEELLGNSWKSYEKARDNNNHTEMQYLKGRVHVLQDLVDYLDGDKSNFENTVKVTQLNIN